MSNKRNASMITAILMGQETCRIHGQVSPNLLYWEKNLPTDICGPRRETNEKSADIQARSSMARTLGENGKETSRWRRSRSDHMKSSILITRENCEGSISLTWRTRNPKKTSRILVRNWKHLCLLPCKIMKKNCGSGASNKVKTRLACILEASESTKLRMGNSIPHHLQDHIAGKGENSLQPYNLVHKFILMPQAMKIPAAKAAVDKEWEKLEKISAWDLTKVRSQKEVIDEARTSDAKVHFDLKNAELEAKHQKQQRSSCTPRWYSKKKNDSGSHTVFFERGLSASQMTAAKVMDIISRLSGCDGQAADAVFVQTQVKMKDVHKNWKFPNRNVQTWWFVFSDTNDQNHGPVWKTQSFLLSGICIIFFWQDHCRKDNLRKSSWNMAGRKFPIRNVSSYTVKKIVFICVCGWHQIDWKETKRWSDVESTQ